MKDTTRDIEDVYDAVNRRYRHADLDPETKQWAADHLREIQADLDQVLAGPVGFQDFLLTYLGREVEKFQADDVDAVPYETLRETPLCTCRDFQCELKRGKLPKEIRAAGTLFDGIRRFKQTHTGDPIVLEGSEDAPGARQAWAEKRAKVWYVLRVLEAYVVDVEHGGELPEEDPLADLDELDRDDLRAVADPEDAVPTLA